jgi:riboflavin biosynthesis pyrimidine reductase
MVTASLDLDLTSEPFQAGRPLLVTATGAPHGRVARAQEVADVVIAGTGLRPDPAAMVHALVGRGLRRILCEGGPRLLGAITAGGLLDELCLTVSPTLAGPGERSRILTGHGSGTAATGPDGIPSAAGCGTAGALPLQLAHVLEDGGFLFARYVRTSGTAN